ncbi:MAG: hypothetical protein ACKVW3_02255 [Phycisphaerales bacterium]
MNDRELERLVRMAVEAERFENEAGDSRLLMPRLRRFLFTSLTTAAAACLLVAVLFAMRPAAPTPLTTRDLIPRPADETVGIQQVSSPERSLVMGIFRDRDGRCTCVRWSRQEWGGRRLSDVGRGELVDAVLKASCTSDPRQVMVVAISGPDEVLPTTREGADRLATALADAADRSQELPSAAYAALGAGAGRATVVTEKVSMRGSSDYLTAMSLPKPPGMR